MLFDNNGYVTAEIASQNSDGIVCFPDLTFVRYSICLRQQGVCMMGAVGLQGLPHLLEAVPRQVLHPQVRQGQGGGAGSCAPLLQHLLRQVRCPVQPANLLHLVPDVCFQASWINRC